MPKTESVTLTYKGSVTPRKTAFLTSQPITMDFESSLDLEDSDIANAKTVQSEFQSAMERQIDAQLKALDDWLAEKNDTLANMMKDFDALKRDGFPKTEQEAKNRAAALKKQEATSLKIDKLEAEWKQIVTDWATNTREQQGLIAVKRAAVAARIKTFNNKQWRVRSAVAVKVVLVVAAVVLSVAAIILTAGTAAPLVLGIAAASAAVSGLVSIGDVGVSISKNWDVEKKLMANLTTDVERVREAIEGAAQSKGALAKHVTEMQNLIKLRTDDIKELETALQKAQAPAKRLAADLGSLKDESLDSGDLAKRRAEVEKMTAEIDETRAQIAKLEEDNAQSRMVLADLETMVGDLSGLSTRTANTLAGNLKKKLTTVDGVMQVGKQIVGLGQAASKFAAAA